MLNLLLSILAITFYILAGGLQGARLTQGLLPKTNLIVSCAIIAVSVHAWLLYQWIDTAMGQNLAFCNVLSQVAWLIAVLILLFTLFKPVLNLGVFVFPWAAITIILVLCFPGSYVLNTGSNPSQLLHILLSFLVLSIFGIAATQAILLTIQDRLLHQHRAGYLLKALPPLETMENLLFQMIAIGFGLFSIVLLTSLFFLSRVVEPKTLHHVLLALLAWSVFAILLWGHKYLGWRGQNAIRWTICGVVILILSY